MFFSAEVAWAGALACLAFSILLLFRCAGCLLRLLDDFGLLVFSVNSVFDHSYSSSPCTSSTTASGVATMA